MPHATDPSYYEILGVPKTATDAEVRSAWLRLAKTLHPDAPGGNQAMFVIASNAYETLRDPMRRSDYDRRLAGDPDEGPGGFGASTTWHGGGPGVEDPPDSPPGPGQTDSGPSGPESSSDPTSDGWVTWGGGSRRSGQPAPRPQRGYRTARQVDMHLSGLTCLAWLGIGAIVSLRNMLFVLTKTYTYPGQVGYGLPERLGAAVGTVALTGVVVWYVARRWPRIRWIYRFALTATLLTFPLYVWSPLGLVGLWVGWESLSRWAWPVLRAQMRQRARGLRFRLPGR